LLAPLEGEEYLREPVAKVFVVPVALTTGELAKPGSPEVGSPRRSE
jgi:hypothetical protein